MSFLRVLCALCGEGSATLQLCIAAWPTKSIDDGRVDLCRHSRQDHQRHNFLRAEWAGSMDAFVGEAVAASPERAPRA
jgi:hypothetical protein